MLQPRYMTKVKAYNLALKLNITIMELEHRFMKQGYKIVYYC